MSDADKQQTKPEASNVTPKACKGCAGLQPRPQLLDVEDMDKLALGTLFRKASIAQQMLTDLMEQLTELYSAHSSNKN